MKNGTRGLKVTVFTGLALLFATAGYATQPLSAPKKLKPVVPKKVIRQKIQTGTKLPDLTFSRGLKVRQKHGSQDIACSKFCTLLAGNTYLFTAEIKNIGQKESRPCRLMFKFFYKEEPGESSFHSRPGRVFNFDVPALYPGTIANIPLEFKLENTGLFYLYALVDSKRQNPESNEENNMTLLGQQLAFKSSAKFVDYAVDASVKRRGGGRLSILSPVRIEIDVWNKGTVPANGGRIEVIFHNSRAGTKTILFDTIMPDAQISRHVSHRYRGPGKKRVTVRVVPAPGISEQSGANNSKTIEFRVN